MGNNICNPRIPLCFPVGKKHRNINSNIQLNSWVWNWTIDSTSTVVFKLENIHSPQPPELHSVFPFLITTRLNYINCFGQWDISNYDMTGDLNVLVLLNLYSCLALYLEIKGTGLRRMREKWSRPDLNLKGEDNTCYVHTISTKW